MNDPSGSQWRRWDLHFHTPKSYDHEQKGHTAKQIVDRLLKEGIAVVAVTDHHVLDSTFIAQMQDAAKGVMTILPGIELTSNLGGSDGVHFIGIFPETADLAHLSAELMSKLEINTKRKAGNTDQQLYVNFPIAASEIQKLGGLISIHAHGKHANFETIKNHFSFKMQLKTDILRNQVDLIEIGDRKHAANYTETVFPAIGMNLPIIMASDDHCRTHYPSGKCCWIKADPTFAGLQMALREPQHRFCLNDTPPAVERLAKNKTKFIKSVSFAKRTSMPRGEEWLQGEMPFNPGLIGIIGNKGSGKSALADAIGLLGSCGNSTSFSFLTDARFCNAKSGRAQHVEATLHWHDGAPNTRLLSNAISADEPERVKYLPQSFVETVCNDLAAPGGGEFEKELKKVVFSKVPAAERLNKRSLDELIEFRTHELRKESDSLATSLISLAKHRADLEERQEPTVKSAIEKQITQLEEEIKSHQAAKPCEVTPPPTDPSGAAETKAKLDALEHLKTQRDKTITDIAAEETKIAGQQLRAAQANKLLEKLRNVQAEFDRRFADLTEDAQVLGLDAAKLAMLMLDRAPVEKTRDEALIARDAAQLALDALPGGLRARKSQLETQIIASQDQLDRPNQERQAYLEQLSAWQAKLTSLQGTKDQPHSLLGLKAELEAIADVPKQIIQLHEQLTDVAQDIHEHRVKEAKVYSELYAPVQKFVSEHSLAKEQLKIEFRVEVVQEGFVENLLSHVNQQRIGSFSGVDEGRACAAALAAPIEWGDWGQVKTFLEQVVEHLHVDKRDGYGQRVSPKSQIGKGKSVGNLYAWLYGLSYLAPRYILKSEGKRIEQLSPGERGTLLLVFYLLVDDSDVPLIIDQPEANLDNATVAKKLVACIRDARDRRQVVIVTHNPNLAVVCDADQIIHASLDIADGHRVVYTSGALENPKINEFTIDVLEGGRVPFDMRDDTYLVCEQ